MTNSFKLCLIGNMNNNFYSFQRYFLKRGIKADLLLFNNENELFSPKNDSFKSLPTESIKYLKWGSVKSFFYTTTKRIAEDLAEYDVIIACGTAPAFLYRAGINIDIFIPYGSDLYDIALFKKNSSIRNIIFNIFSCYQSRGIKKSLIAIDPVPGTKISSEPYQILKKEYFQEFFPLFYHHEYLYINYTEISKEVVDKMSEISREYDRVMVSHSRHIWKTHIDKYSSKGNDKLIRGFSEYCKETERKAILILFDYGVDVEESKKVIKELKLDNVYWFDKKPRKDIMYIIQNSHIVLDEFESGFFGGVGQEALYSHKPLVCYIECSRIKNIKKPPVLNSKNEDDIKMQLLKCDCENYYTRLCNVLKKWMDANFGESLIDKWLLLIERVYKNKDGSRY